MTRLMNHDSDAGTRPSAGTPPQPAALNGVCSDSSPKGECSRSIQKKSTTLPKASVTAESLKETAAPMRKWSAEILSLNSRIGPYRDGSLVFILTGCKPSVAFHPIFFNQQ